MSLKGNRTYNEGVDISYFMNATGERGGIVLHSTGGSGAAMDDDDAVVAYPTGQSVSGTSPAGLLLNDVVNYDLTTRHINFHKDETQVGGKVTLLRHGVVVTNWVSGSPTIGQKAYYLSDGRLTGTDPTNGVQVGRFLSTKDADGYAKVEINIV